MRSRTSASYRFPLNGEAPRSRILKVTQDDHGFLWLATTTGLYRYDGYRLKHYQHEPGDPASLSADRLWTVYKDRAGTLWIGTNEGLDRLDAAGDTFTHYRHDPADDRSLSGEQVFSIHQDAMELCGSARVQGSTGWTRGPAASPTSATTLATTRP